MVKFACMGTGEYLRKGVRYLVDHGFEQAFDPELLICLAHPEILSRSTLDKYPLGCINFHAGLPKYRGRHPLQWMLIDGVPEIPIAVHQMDEGIDTGPILAEDKIPVERDETYDSALKKVTNAMGPLLVKALERIENGYGGRVQNKSELGYTPRREPGDSKIDWMLPAERVHRFINALSDPMPNAFDAEHTYKRSYSGMNPGKIIAKCTDGRVVVACGTGIVLVDIA